MKTRGVLGKKIVKVNHSRTPRTGGRPSVVAVISLELEDGTILTPYTIETDVGEYYHGFRVHKKKLPNGQH